MTKAEAKELSLEVWRYLAEHLEIKYKCDLPNEIFNKIRFMRSECPLCEVFAFSCNGCPLDDEAIVCRQWAIWACRKNDYIREQAALTIIRKINAWKVT